MEIGRHCMACSGLTFSKPSLLTNVATNDPAATKLFLEHFVRTYKVPMFTSNVVSRSSDVGANDSGVPAKRSRGCSLVLLSELERIAWLASSPLFWEARHSCSWFGAGSGRVQATSIDYCHQVHKPPTHTTPNV